MIFHQPPAPITNLPLAPGSVVSCSEGFMGVQALSGEVVPCDRLGVGVVEGVDSEGRLRVRWPLTDLTSWVERDELKALGADARLLVVNECDSLGHTKKLRNKVLGSAGLRYNWRVELRPKGVIRVVRWDGQAWTFRKSPLFRHVLTPGWLEPPDDEDAEALTAAELSL